MLAGPRPSTEVPNAGVDVIFVMFVGNNFLAQTISFGNCQGVVFLHEYISSEPFKTTPGFGQFVKACFVHFTNSNTKLRIYIRGFNLALLGEKAVKFPRWFFSVLTISRF